MDSEAKNWGYALGGLGWLLVVVVGISCLFMWGCPHYHVWEQGLKGEAELRRAEQNRKIVVQEAEAKMESAKLLANAEIERSKGVAESNRIIGDGLKGHSEYLMYLWIQSLGDKDNHVIYVPTEANLPILEASRFRNPIREK